MKTTLTAALAGLLLAGVSTTALAQERDGGRGRGQGPRQGEASQVQDRGQRQDARQEIFGRGIYRPAPQMARQEDRPPAAAPPAPNAPRAQAPGANGRQGEISGRGVARPSEQQWDNRRGDRERYAGDRGDRGDRGRDNRNWDRGDYGRGNDRDWDRRRGERPPNWERGRYPPTYQSQQRYRAGAYRTPYGYYSRSWGFGDILPRGWYGDSYRIGSFWDYDLPYPPPGYEWVRVGGDALLIDAYTGRVVQVVRYLFW